MASGQNDKIPYRPRQRFIALPLRKEKKKVGVRSQEKGAIYNLFKVMEDSDVNI